MSTKPTAGPPPPSWPETRVESWAALQEVIDRLSGRCLFRGQSSHQWPLITSFNRALPGVDETLALYWEKAAILNFLRDAHAYLPPTVIPPNMFKLSALDTYLEWLMIMQHYGAPTRLLDWSETPYVAAYFAVNDRRADDAAIWYFESAPAFTGICVHYNKGPDAFVDYGDYSSDEIRDPTARPMLYMASKKMRTAREVAQQGMFTFSNRLNVNQQSVIAETCRGFDFGRIIIPQSLKMEICRQLRLMNVTSAALFPGVEGVCSSIRDTLRLASASLATPSPAPIPQAE